VRTKYKKQKTSGNAYGDQTYDVVGIFTFLYVKARSKTGGDDIQADISHVLTMLKKAHKVNPWIDNDGFGDMHRLCPQGECTLLDGTNETEISTIVVRILPPEQLVWSRLRAFNNYLETLGSEMKRVNKEISKVQLTFNISSSVTLLD
jgi:hypothetical protein